MRKRAGRALDLGRWIAFSLFFFVLQAFGTTYYVSSSTGSDSNSGTSPSSPWQTITQVNAGSYAPGDSILFKTGDTWAGTPNFSAALTTPNAGTSGNPITYGSYGTGAAPILDGANSLGTLIVISQNYISITGVQLQNATYSWISYTGTTGTSLTYITGKNTETWGFYGYSGLGTTLIDHTSCSSDSNWTMIAWCYIAQGNGPVTFTNNTCDFRNLNASSSHPACAEINGSSQAVIQYNHAYGGSQAFSIKPGSPNPATVTGGLIADNYAYQITPLSGGDGEAISLEGSSVNPQSGVTVTRNVIICQSGTGGTQAAISHYYSSNDNVSANLIVGGCGTENAVHISSSSSGTYYNNTFSGAPGLAAINVWAGSSVTAENNIFDDFAVGIYCHSCASVTEDYNLYNSNVVTPVNGATLGSNSITGIDPLFVNTPPATENDVKLQDTSPAVGAGANPGSSSALILNPQGTAVPFGTFDQSSAWMMGAFGYPARKMTKMAGDNQSSTVGSAFQTPLQVAVTDSNGNPLNGVTVVYSSVAGSSGANGTFSGSTNVTTDSSGEATAPALTANSTAGQFTVQAKLGSAAATFSLSNVGATTITKTAGDNQSTPVNTAFSTGLQVKLTDSNTNPVAGVTVTFSPNAGTAGASGAFSGSATVTTDSNGVATAPALTANSISGQFSVTASANSLSASFTLTNLGGTATLQPTSLSFGNQNLNSTSAPQTITLSNSGSAALSITGVAITGTNPGDFSQTNTCGPSVAAGASCTISVTFTPQATGSRSASVAVADNAPGSPQTTTLSGAGVGVAQVSLNPTTVSFGNQNVNTTSAAQSITLSNPGSGPLAITSIAIAGTNPGDFSQTNTCGTSVAAGASCTVSVTFSPQATGSCSASVAITDSATGSPQTASLSGTGVGVAQVSLNPTALSLGNQNVKSTSAAQSITLSNPGSGPLSITSIAMTGTNAADFSQTNTCGTSVAAGASCTISVTFTPQATGARSGSVVVTDNATGSPQTASLSGTGVGVAQVSLNPTALSFGNQNVKTTSAAQSITLSNPGSGPLSITSIATTGSNPTDFAQTNACGISLAAGASCTISVTFTPQAAGTRSASLVVTDNATGSPQAATLSGTGLGVAQVSLNPIALSFGNQNVKTTSAAKAITLSNTGSATLSITSLAITGTNSTDFTQTNTCGTSVAAGASCTISLKFTPQAAGTRSASLVVTDTATGSPQTASLGGTGVPIPQILLSPSSLSFAYQNVKSTSTARTITLSNPGSAALSITSIAMTGTNAADFTQTNTCGTSVAAGASCSISIKFTPQGGGARSASLSITDNAAGSPQKAALTGTGVPITFNPSTLSFGNEKLKTATSARTITVSNLATTVAWITSIAITGTDAADFSQTHTCGASIAAGASCTISVKFTPQASGSRSAFVTVTDNASGSPQKATLTGVGVPIALSPSSVSFTSQVVKTTSSAQTITLSNLGTTAISITSIKITGTNAADFGQTNTCGSSVAAGGSCKISVKFTPQATGSRSAALTITDSAAGSPETATLTGTGVS